jgi:RNA polymerase sigma-70 factor (ECF subfamily)
MPAPEQAAPALLMTNEPPAAERASSAEPIEEDASDGSAAAPPAFEQLYALYFGFTWRVLGHLGVAPHSLDDAVQDVWVVVHRRLPVFEGRSALKTWLFGIALNVARNQRRADERRAHGVPTLGVEDSPHSDPELVHAGNEAWQRVQRFLSTLDEQRRGIFVCNLIEHLSAQETAEATGVDVTTVYQRVRSLRQAFKTWLHAEVRERELP